MGAFEQGGAANSTKNGWEFFHFSASPVHPPPLRSSASRVDIVRICARNLILAPLASTPQADSRAPSLRKTHLGMAYAGNRGWGLCGSMCSHSCIEIRRSKLGFCVGTCSVLIVVRAAGCVRARASCCVRLGDMAGSDGPPVSLLVFLVGEFTLRREGDHSPRTPPPLLALFLSPCLASGYHCCWPRAPSKRWWHLSVRFAIPWQVVLAAVVRTVLHNAPLIFLRQAEQSQGQNDVVMVADPYEIAFSLNYTGMFCFFLITGVHLTRNRCEVKGREGCFTYASRRSR